MTTEHMALDRPSAFRRRRFVSSHRKKSSTLLLIRPFVTAVVVVSIPIATAYWLSVTTRFDLNRIDLSGTHLVEGEQVLATLEPVLKRNLLLLSLEEVEAQVQQNRWVKGATIRKELPDALTVVIHERVPVALVRHQEDLYYVDLDGILIEPYSTSGPVDLPLLTVSADVELDVALALEVVERLSEVAPVWGAGLSEVEILGEQDFRLHSAALDFPLLVSAGTVVQQVENLQSILADIQQRYEVPITVDLRFAQQIVIQPAVEPRSEKG